MSSSVKVFRNPFRPDQVKQGPGQSETEVMSQKAVTEKFAAVREVPAGIQGQIVGFDAEGNPVAQADGGGGGGGGGGTGIFAPVADLTALKTLDTTTAEDWPDKWAIYVESVKLFYALDRESTAADDGDTVIAPTTGAGRWHRKVIPLATPTKEGLQSGSDKAKQDKFGEDASQNPTYNTVKILREGDAPAVDAADLTAMEVGQTNLFTVQKQADGSAKYGAGIEQIDKLGPPSLSSILADDQAWNGHTIELTGDNAAGALGENSQEYHYKRRWYLCIAHTSTGATWQRNTMVDILDSADIYDSSIISELEDSSGWADNKKQVSVKSVKGDDYISPTLGYSYHCYTEDNKWFRVKETGSTQITNQALIDELLAVTEPQWGSGNQYNLSEGIVGDYYAATADGYYYTVIDSVNHTWKRVGVPPVLDMYVTDATLITGITSHDYTSADYDATTDTTNNPTVHGAQGQQYYDKTNRVAYECFENGKWRKG